MLPIQVEPVDRDRMKLEVCPIGGVEPLHGNFYSYSLCAADDE